MLLLEITLADRNDVGCSLHRPMYSQPNGERSLGENGGRHAKDQNQHSYGAECFVHGILHLPLSSGNLVSRNSFAELEGCSHAVTHDTLYSVGASVWSNPRT